MFTRLKNKIEEDEQEDPLKWLCIFHNGKVTEEHETWGTKIVCKDTFMDIDPKELSNIVREAWEHYDGIVHAEYLGDKSLVKVVLNKRNGIDFCDIDSGYVDLLIGAEFEGDWDKLAEVKEKVYKYVSDAVENYKGLGGIDIYGNCPLEGVCFVQIIASMPIKYFESFGKFLGTVKKAAEEAFDRAIGRKKYRFLEFKV